VVSITLYDLVLHSQIESDEDSADLNYYLDYSYTDFCMIILKFPCDIELLGSNRVNREIKNNVGECLFHLDIVGNNQLIIQSNYKVIKDTIPKGEYNQIKEVNDFVQEIKSMRVLIKLRNQKLSDS
jgi:hypothetical protein